MTTASITTLLLLLYTTTNTMAQQQCNISKDCGNTNTTMCYSGVCGACAIGNKCTSLAGCCDQMLCGRGRCIEWNTSGSSTGSDDSAFRIGMIVGSVVFVLIFVGCISMWCLRRRRTQVGTSVGFGSG
ncbi:hypothetical protein BDR26DRAFT_852354 [Obelidium mucronatum]|nr:hypothetical protein BDR26DRAFT_852354 [Obelidium mucronatum]